MSVTGTLVLVPNPCTTRPCLPGMALAVQGEHGGSGHALRYLTKGGAYVVDPADLGRAIRVGASVRVAGIPHEAQDTDGEVVVSIETERVDAE